MKRHEYDLLGLLLAAVIVICILLLGAIFGHAQTINHLWYEPKNCHRDGEITRCSHVLIEFFGISAKAVDVSGPGPAVEIVNREHPEGPRYEYHYIPAKCKPIKDTKFHVCKDVYWRELQ